MFKDQKKRKKRVSSYEWKEACKIKFPVLLLTNDIARRN